MSKSVGFMVHKVLMGDACFVYTAFAPMKVVDSEKEPDNVLVKVGVSATPMKRISQVHMGSPFSMEFAAFAPAGWRKTATKVESGILARFKEYKTRGEWLMLPCTKEMKSEFSAASREILSLAISGRPVKWTRVTGKEIIEYGVADLREYQNRTKALTRRT